MEWNAGGDRGRRESALLFDQFKTVEDRHAQRVGDHLDGVQRGVGNTAFDPAQVRLVKTTAFTESDLAHAGVLAQLTHTGSESSSDW